MEDKTRANAVTIYDISEKAGFSIATVSRVLNGSSKVSPRTKERVLEVIDEYGYEPNVFARGLGTGTMKTIGILCADVADLYLANAVSFLERELRQHGFEALLSCTGYEYEDKVSCTRMMESRKVDAIIMVGSHYVESSAKKNEYIIETSERIPVMLLNGFLKGDNIYCNLSDDYTAFYEATSLLTKQGNKHIVFLFREATYSAKQKKLGYINALKDIGKSELDMLFFQSKNRIQDVKAELEVFFNENPETDAIIACDDELAVGALKYLSEMRIDVPRDVAVVGCNNSVLSICCQPELTSIDNMCEILCVNTTEMLMRILDGQRVANKTVVGCRIVERSTTGKRENQEG